MWIAARNEKPPFRAVSLSTDARGETRRLRLSLTAAPGNRNAVPMLMEAVCVAVGWAGGGLIQIHRQNGKTVMAKTE
ncbi:hypothetical protein MishRS11D_46100 (plasmid) [Methylomagnum ishizawai]|nr:hypothetical protein MishRS11D_46100 [Methylomagnum ishizawai]